MGDIIRKLATIRVIDRLEPIPNSDFLWKATVGGWSLVTAKDNGFKEGDKVIYLELDSWVPTEIAGFLSKGKEPREYNGVKGERLRTIRLRGQISQGLILPLQLAIDLFPGSIEDEGQEFSEFFFEGSDLTRLLNIQKWEPEIAANMQGKQRGNFPHFVRKTDQERCQNLKKELNEHLVAGTVFEATGKLDGSSMTVYVKTEWEFGVPTPGHIETIAGVCSRNIDLQLDQTGNAFVDYALNNRLLQRLTAYCEVGFRSLALQGELCGPGIQGNKDGLSAVTFFLYDIWDIQKQAYVSPAERSEIIKDLSAMGDEIKHVPVIGSITLSEIGDEDNLIQNLLAHAEGPSFLGLNQNPREGVVYKSADGSFSFKAISNKFLEETGE